MNNLIEKVEKEFKIPREVLIKEGLKHFLEIEMINRSIEIRKLGKRYGVDSFNELWGKLEVGKVTEAECFDDLSRLEYLELEKEKIAKLIEESD